MPWIRCLVVLFCAVPNQAFGGQSFEDRLKDEIDRFHEQEQKIAGVVLKKFDKFENTLQRRLGLSESARAELIKSTRENRKLFATKRQFPDDPATAAIEIDYFTALNRNFLRIRRIFEQELARLNKEGLVERADSVVSHRDRVEEALLGPSAFHGGASFRGTLMRQSSAAVPFKLHISEVSDGGIFKGRVEDNPGVAGHWKYNVEGVVAGNALEFRMTENLRGKLTFVRGQGIVAGDRLVATLVQRAGKKKPSANVLFLRN